MNEKYTNSINTHFTNSERIGDFPYSIYKAPSENELVVMDLNTLKKLKKEIYQTIWNYLCDRLKIIFEQNEGDLFETQLISISKQYDDLSGETTIHYNGALVFDRSIQFAKQGEWLRYINESYLEFAEVKNAKIELEIAQQRAKLISQILGEN